MAQGLLLSPGMNTCLHAGSSQIKTAQPLRGGRGWRRRERGRRDSARTCTMAPCPASGKWGRKKGGSKGSDAEMGGGVDGKAIRDTRVTWCLVAYPTIQSPRTCTFTHLCKGSDLGDHQCGIYALSTSFNAVELSIMRRMGA